MIRKSVSVEIIIEINYTIENKAYNHEFYKMEDLKDFINWLIDKQGHIKEIKIK